MAPAERLVVVEDVDAFRFRYGDIAVAGQWSGGLGNRSETLALAVRGEIVQQVQYDDGWYPITDGAGYSLDAVDTSADVGDWSQVDSWRPSGPRGGTPGAPPALIGDANLDGVFDEQDLLQVFQFGKYLGGVASNASWAEGDWNRDGQFDDQDIVAAFVAGHYTAPTRLAVREMATAIDAVLADDNLKRGFLE